MQCGLAKISEAEQGVDYAYISWPIKHDFPTYLSTYTDVLSTMQGKFDAE